MLMPILPNNLLHIRKKAISPRATFDAAILSNFSQLFCINNTPVTLQAMVCALS